MDNEINISIPRKKWAKPEKIYLPLILDDNAEDNLPKDNLAEDNLPEDNLAENQIDTPDNTSAKISKWRLKSHKFINISFNKRSKKIRT